MSDISIVFHIYLLFDNHGVQSCVTKLVFFWIRIVLRNHCYFVVFVLCEIDRELGSIVVIQGNKDLQQNYISQNWDLWANIILLDNNNINAISQL